ncbi:MAG: sensor histidine kinase [Bacteroidota bacterium]|jgi:two-component system LytT family sensor kinase
MRKKFLYWSFQFGGWALFILLQILFFKLSKNKIDSSAVFYFLSSYILGIFLTHVFRWIVLKFSWLSKSLVFQIPLLMAGSMVLAVVFELIHYFMFQFVFLKGLNFNLTEFLQNSINIGFVFVLWNLIYFSFHYFEKYRQSEISNLKFQFSMNEIELNKLKSQLNPHFMFNAMNSIRALIDEDPARAKMAITMLSNILRNTLQMEKNKLISFDDELSIVKDYLELEHIRFEKRLSYNIQITENLKDFRVPTMMIQTLVENGIKHGISKLVDGGTITLHASVYNEKLFIKITNPGKLNMSATNENGYGIKNTKQRLDLLYGTESKFDIYQSGIEVVTEIYLPKFKKEDGR